ncbi:MAG TPA: PSD1 and planctomycete cytochrome C domain-containing protein [Bryobacteraceae bacterium]|nr:PSD1 and planctomycete cytochrome C domain-containing protein [Bryobacteraceae bacterium]
MRKLFLIPVAWAAVWAQGAPDFARDVQPILQKRCFGCHGSAQTMGNLRLDREESATTAGRRIVEAVGRQGKIKMPPGGTLPEEEVSVLRAWAGGLRPWSFAPIRRPAEPVLKNANWRRNAVDSFVLAALEARGIGPSREAERRTLARRLYLDLTGLPPSPEQVEAFLADGRPDAYERLVDSLLASPHYGEKIARHWLDLARYADSEGGVQDYGRPWAWRYRDWVIDAFNRDMPFDRFTVLQMAGDLLPRAGLEERTATGFHRQTITSREGGVELDRIRFEQLVDRASTVGTVWLGLTVGCAQCHDHKYDPISQKDFYSMLAFFENADEADLDAPLPGEWGIYRQYAKTFRAEREKLLAEYGIAGTLAEWEDGLRDAMENPGRRPNWDVNYDSYSKQVDHGRRTLLTARGKRTERDQDALTDYFVKSSQGTIGKEKYDGLKLKELGEKLKKLDEKYPRMSRLMTLEESGRKDATHVRIRGNWTDKGEAVAAGTPKALPVLAGGTAGRLALGEWLVAKENPLSARVTVNRLWQEFFGRGLVRTSEDFGAQGEKPTHPELLDWLAAEFQDGWSVKKMVRLLVTSATYRQASEARPDLSTVDPLNTLLARQARLRLPAELIRDSALRVSGLLNDAVGGESIRPPQPAGVADLQYSMKWEETGGRARYRRGLYVFLQRTATYPLLMNFDVPDRTVSCSRRETSNTPLQPLNLMNDPVFVEAAQALAARIEEAPEAERLDRAFALCFGRAPTGRERDAVLSHVARRGWFGASRALLNTDEFLTRE